MNTYTALQSPFFDFFPLGGNTGGNVKKRQFLHPKNEIENEDYVFGIFFSLNYPKCTKLRRSGAIFMFVPMYTPTGGAKHSQGGSFHNAQQRFFLISLPLLLKLEMPESIKSCRSYTNSYVWYTRRLLG